MPRNGRQNGIVELETILVLRCDQSKGSDSGNMKGKKNKQNKQKAGLQTETVGIFVNGRKNSEIFRKHSDIMFAMQNIRMHP